MFMNRTSLTSGRRGLSIGKIGLDGLLGAEHTYGPSANADVISLAVSAAPAAQSVRTAVRVAGPKAA